MRANLIAFIVGMSLLSATELYAQESASATPLWFVAPTSTTTSSQEATRPLWFQPNSSASETNAEVTTATTSFWTSLPRSSPAPETRPSRNMPEAATENHPFWMHTLESQSPQHSDVAGRPVGAATTTAQDHRVPQSSSFWASLPSQLEKSKSPDKSKAAKSLPSSLTSENGLPGELVAKVTEPSGLAAPDAACPSAQEATWVAERQSAESGETRFEDLISGLNLDQDPPTIANQHRSESIVTEPANNEGNWWAGGAPVLDTVPDDIPQTTESSSIEQLIRTAQFISQPFNSQPFNSQRDNQASPSDAPATHASPINIVMDEDEAYEAARVSSTGRISDSENQSLLLDVNSMIGRGSGATSLFGRLEVEDEFLDNSQYITTAARMNELQMEWMPYCYTWISPVFYHKPLYFEQPNLERYGLGCAGPLQPLISSAHFFGSIPLVPYKTLTHHPREKVYTLGHGRPGNCVPVRRRVLLGESTVGEGLLFWDKCSGYAE